MSLLNFKYKKMYIQKLEFSLQTQYQITLILYTLLVNGVFVKWHGNFTILKKKFNFVFL